MTLHFHMTPITPRQYLLDLAGRCFGVSFERGENLVHAHQLGQAVMLDNGAFTAWTQDRPVTDWTAFYRWVEPWLDYRTSWAVIPDSIEGGEEENDALIEEWPFGDRGAPVWHLHESIDRLVRLCEEWPRVCLGSSGAYGDPGSPAWHRRMIEAMNELCGDGPAPTWLHLLRGLDYVGDHPYPIASADSSNIGQNHGRQRRLGEGIKAFADRLDSKQAPARWQRVALTDPLFA